MMNRLTVIALCGLVLPEICQAADEPNLKQLVERLNRQDERIHDLQHSVTNLTRLLFNPTDPQVSEAVVRRGEQGFRSLYTIHRDGTNLQYLLGAPGMIVTGTPQWSHDGKTIVCDSMPQLDQPVLSRIWVYGVSGPFKGMIRHLSVGNTPSWSPDDTQIAFMVNPGNPDGIKAGAWIMDADGRNARWIGEGWYTRWSPLGNEICVYAHFTNPPSLVIYDLKADKSRTILGGDTPVIFGGANWTRDGQRLVTLVRKNGEQQLVTIAASGDLETLRVVYRETDENRVLVGPPAISPDGKEIVFIRQELEHEDAGSRQWMNTYLYLVSADGQGQPRLLEGVKLGKINRSVDWSPDGQRILFSSER